MTNPPTPRPPLTVMKPSPPLTAVPPAPDTATTPASPNPAAAAASSEPSPAGPVRQGPHPITSVALTVNRGDAVILRSIHDLTQDELDDITAHATTTLGPDIPVLVLNGRRWGIHVIRGGSTR